MHYLKRFTLLSLLFFYILTNITPALAQQSATDFFKISQRAFEYKDYDNVIFFSNKAIELNPQYGAAYWNRAIAYDCKGEYRKSVSDYSTAIKLYENNTDLASLYKNQGMVYISMKLYDSAIADFNSALKLNPDYGVAWWNRAIAFEGLKKYDSAAKNYSAAIGLIQDSNDLSQLYISRGIDYQVLNKKEKADSDFHKVLKLNKEPGYYRSYALFLLGDKKAAADQISKSIAAGKSKPKEIKNAYFNAASIYAIMNNDEDALKYLELALKNGYNDFQYIAKDRDFDSIREQSAFKELIKKYKQ